MTISHSTIFIHTVGMAVVTRVLTSHCCHRIIWRGMHRRHQTMVGIVAIHARAIRICVVTDAVGVAMIWDIPMLLLLQLRKLLLLDLLWRKTVQSEGINIEATRLIIHDGSN